MEYSIKTGQIIFSVIVVSYNAEKSIARTINSVLQQSIDDYEIIVKDGLSDDCTVKQIPNSSKIRVYEEKDTGIYDAMNQSIKYARGRYLCFLNCGDVFTDSSILDRIKATINSSEKDMDIVYGDFICNNILYASPKLYNKKNAFFYSLCHQSIFFKKEILERLGKYDCSFQIAADYDFLLKVVNHKIDACVHVPYPICVYERGGVSEQFKKRGFSEQAAARKKEYSSNDYMKYTMIEIITLRRLRRHVNGDWMPYWLRNGLRKLLNRMR